MTSVAPSMLWCRLLPCLCTCSTMHMITMDFAYVFFICTICTSAPALLVWRAASQTPAAYVLERIVRLVRGFCTPVVVLLEARGCKQRAA
jgi:hypothetical protein